MEKLKTILKVKNEDEDSDGSESPGSPTHEFMFDSPKAEDEQNKPQKFFRGKGNVTVDNYEDYVAK